MPKHGKKSGKMSSGMVGNSKKMNPDKAGEYKSVPVSGGNKGMKGARARVPADRYK